MALNARTGARDRGSRGKAFARRSPIGRRTYVEPFSDSWCRIVRPVVFGPTARDAYELYQILNRLRSWADWTFLSPQRARLREELMARIRGYLLQARPESLAGVIAQIPVTGRTAPEQQVPQWLFAFEARAMATFRGLALLASHLENADYVRQEIADQAGSFTCHISSRHRPGVFAAMAHHATCLAREHSPDGMGKRRIAFRSGYRHLRPRSSTAMASGCLLPINSPHSVGWTATGHKAGRLSRSARGPQRPGRELVLLLSTTMLSALRVDSQWELKRPTRIESGKPLPGTLSHLDQHFLNCRDSSPDLPAQIEAGTTRPVPCPPQPSHPPDPTVR